MDKQTADIIKEIIDLDCTMTNAFSDGKGNFCFVGGLFATIAPDWASGNSLTPHPVNIWAAIISNFGLTAEFLNDAVSINDRRPDRLERVAALKAHVDAHTTKE